MDVLIVGSGGREHAIIKTLKKSRGIRKIYALPGNGGIANDAECVGIDAKDIDGIVDFAVSHNIGYAVVVPDDPLALGAVDRLTDAGVPCFGPTRAAAQIEASKVFAKALMKKYNIPTSNCEVFDDMSAALEYVARAPLPIVVKADGLALGKGVIIACDRKEASDAVKAMMGERIFGESGARVVIEEFLCGPEVSVLSFTDGKTVIPMVSSMDHKRVFDGDLGPNTGGMGAVAPNPYYTDEIAEICMEKIFLPTVKAMNAEGRTFHGCLYFGLMITDQGPKVIEYNCRFGDPETQVVLPLLKGDLLEIMQATTNGTLDSVKFGFEKKSACCVVIASKGYPVRYEKGFEIDIPDNVGAEVYVAGAKLSGGKLLSSGGRVLGVTATADSLKEAIDKAYSAVEKIRFEGGFYRRDIGARAIKAANAEEQKAISSDITGGLR